MKAQGKRFLTERGDEGGSVRWHAVTDDDDYAYQILDAELHITDCEKVVVLEFSCPSYKAIAKRIAKVDELLQELTNFKAALQQAQRHHTPKKFHY